MLAARDPVVGELASRHGLPRLGAGRRTPASTRFAALAESILYQQLAGRAAAAIHARFVAALDGEVTAERVLATDPDRLAACGLSGAKLSAVRDLADKVIAGEVTFDRIGRLSDDDVVAQLTQVRGVGRWTAEMFLIFTLGRRDVWPVDDYGVRAGYASAWSLDAMPKPTELHALGEPYRPLRSLVAWYCWRAAEERRKVPDAPERREAPDGGPPARAAGRSAATGRLKRRAAR